VSDFKNLKVWRKAHALALNVHRVAVRIRGAEFGSLRGQMIRAAFSIPTNVVEGNGQESPQQFARFVRFSLNSTSELEYHLIVARDARAITATDFDSLSSQTVEVRKMLYGLLRHLDRSRLDPAAPKGRRAVTKS
jgi:four helix bundle protein